MSSKNQTPNSTVQLTLIPPNHTNSLLKENLNFFKKNHPQIYNVVLKHKCSEFQLCSNPDGSPNILDMKSKQPLYHAFTINDIMESIRKNVTSMLCNAQIISSFVCGGEKEWRENNPIQVSMLNKLYKAGIFQYLNLTSEFLTPLHTYSTDYFPLVRVNGVGLGFHLTELIKQKSISYMTIYEPYIDLFYVSLYTIPWQLIFKYFARKNKGINLVLGGTPDAAIKNNIAFIRDKLMPLTSCFYHYNHLVSEITKEVITKQPQSDAVERQQGDAGWYEDQRIGFYLSARNIRKSSEIFTGKKVNSYFRAFIVGSGPSLNETINYINTHQDDAIIVSCGSAITPLLNAGIVPDYEVVQERVWHFEEHEEKHDLELLKQVTLLKLNVVSPKIDKHYKETLVFQKFRDPGSSLLGKKYAVTTAVNPTVTNAGISMCAALGVNEAYLFGVDYGAPIKSTKMHAENTMYDANTIDDSVSSRTNFELPGNLGTVIRTDTVLSWSHQTTEHKIQEHPEIRWFNVGEGALIAGAKPVNAKDLPQIFSKRIHKKKLKKEISSCFNNHYSPVEVLDSLKTSHTQQVHEYFEALLGFTQSTPKTREEIVGVLSLLYKAANVGQNHSHFLPASLLSYGFKQFITDVYIQSSLAVDDSSATRFFEASKDILADYIVDIDKDLTKVLNYIDLDTETDLVKIWKKMGE